MAQNELENLGRSQHCDDSHQSNLSANCWADMANDHHKKHGSKHSQQEQQPPEHRSGLGGLLHSAGSKLGQLAHSDAVHNATSKLGQLAHGETAHKAQEQLKDLGHSRLAHEAQNSAKGMIPGGDLIKNPQHSMEQLKQGKIPGGVEGLAGLALHASPLGMLGRFGAGIAQQEIHRAQQQKKHEQHQQHHSGSEQQHHEKQPEHGAKM